MRIIPLAMVLSGCVGAVPVQVPIDGPGPCNADKLQSLVGTKLTDEMQQSLLKASGSRTLRVIPPGAAVTMDYRADRLNIDVDADGKVTGIKCG